MAPRLFPFLKFAWSLLLAGAALDPVTSSDAAPAARSGAHIVFLVSSPEDTNSYESARTMPAFAEMLSREHGYRTTVLQAEFPESASRFPNIQAVWQADLLVVFCRRLGLPPDQLTTIKNHINAGKPVVAIKTANHGFAVNGPFVPGHFAWWEFVADVLGAENRGYGPARGGSDVTIVPETRNHPIVSGLPASWHSGNNLYFNELLDRDATVLMTGAAGGRVEPIAWTRMAGGSRVFYTSLGHPADFEDPRPYFRTLLVNAIHWALNES